MGEEAQLNPNQFQFGWTGVNSALGVSPVSDSPAHILLHFQLK